MINELTLTVSDMPVKKVRIDVFNNGDRYTISFEGKITRDKVLHLLDLIELLGGMYPVDSRAVPSASQKSKVEKVRLVAHKNFPVGWFSSKELQSAYERQFNEPISLSTISTYLSRLADRGFFIKKVVSNKISYRIMNVVSSSKIKIE